MFLESGFLPSLLCLVRPTSPEVLLSHSWNIKQMTFYHEMYLALVLTNTVDVLLQQGLFLICINTGEVKPMVATKLLGFEPIRLKYFEK